MRDRNQKHARRFVAYDAALRARPAVRCPQARQRLVCWPPLPRGWDNMSEHDPVIEGRRAPARPVAADATLVEQTGRVDDEVLTSCASFQIRAADTERGRSKAR